MRRLPGTSNRVSVSKTRSMAWPNTPITRRLRWQKVADVDNIFLWSIAWARVRTIGRPRVECGTLDRSPFWEPLQDLLAAQSSRSRAVCRVVNPPYSPGYVFGLLLHPIPIPGACTRGRATCFAGGGWLATEDVVYLLHGLGANTSHRSRRARRLRRMDLKSAELRQPRARGTRSPRQAHSRERAGGVMKALVAVRRVVDFNVKVRFKTLAVGLLAQRLAGDSGVQAPGQRDLAALSRQQLKVLQTALNQHGFDSGTPDGVMDPATRAGTSAPGSCPMPAAT